MMLCAAMTVEPAAAYGTDFTDGANLGIRHYKILLRYVGDK